MTKLDTAAEREEMRRRPYQLAGQYAHRRFLTVLAEYDLLRGRRDVAADEIDRLRADAERDEAQYEAMADALTREGIKLTHLRDEATSVLQLMDGLAEQWGDEGVFRRCRDRLRAAIESTGGGDG